MITVAPKEAEVLRIYKESGSLAKVAERGRMSINTARHYMIEMMRRGLVERMEKGKYRVLDVPYTVKTFEEKMAEIRKLKQRLQVTMSDAEQKWMMEHYKAKYQRNRGEAARILGRTRSDICLMAIALGLQIKDGEQGGKGNKSRSA